MKKILAAMVAALLMVSLVSSVALANDQHGNVGTAYGLSGSIQDAAGNYIDYTCASVHRTVVKGGWQDKENCVLASVSSDGTVATFPLKATTYSYTLHNFLPTFPDYCSFDGTLIVPTATYHDYSGATYNPTIWYSDYTYATTYNPGPPATATYETAATWSYKLGTNGSFTLTAFFPTIPIPDPCY